MSDGDAFNGWTPSMGPDGIGILRATGANGGSINFILGWPTKHQEPRELGARGTRESPGAKAVDGQGHSLLSPFIPFLNVCLMFILLAKRAQKKKRKKLFKFEVGILGRGGELSSLEIVKSSRLVPSRFSQKIPLKIGSLTKMTEILLW